MKINSDICNLAIKNVEILHNNIGKFSSYSWIIKGWTISAWAAIFLLNTSPHRIILMYLILALGFIACELIRVIEHVTIEKVLKLERAISMVYLGKDRSLLLHGFSTNLKKISFEEIEYVMKLEKFSLTRFLYGSLLIATIVVQYFLL